MSGPTDDPKKYRQPSYLHVGKRQQEFVMPESPDPRVEELLRILAVVLSGYTEGVAEIPYTELYGDVPQVKIHEHESGEGLVVTIL